MHSCSNEVGVVNQNIIYTVYACSILLLKSGLQSLDFKNVKISFTKVRTHIYIPNTI